MGGDGNYGSYGSGWELCGTAGPGYQPGQLTKEKNIRKRKKIKKKNIRKRKRRRRAAASFIQEDFAIPYI